MHGTYVELSTYPSEKIRRGRCQFSQPVPGFRLSKCHSVYIGTAKKFFLNEGKVAYWSVEKSIMMNTTSKQSVGIERKKGMQSEVMMT